LNPFVKHVLTDALCEVLFENFWVVLEGTSCDLYVVLAVSKVPGGAQLSAEVREWLSILFVFDKRR
jgi:hypothetical protein